MSNIVFSDSQESALFGEDVYNDLQNEIDIPNINPMMLEDLEDRKFDTASLCHYTQEALLESDRKYMEPKTPVPIKDEFPGEFNFELILPNTQGKHWMFSQMLGKVFINMEQTLPLQFKWDPPVPNLYLRTAMVFSLDQYRSDPVQRCHNHMASKNPTYSDPMILKHVVRCTDVESIYEERKGHLSVVTPLRSPQAGSQYVPMYFQFLCKNSCPSGMNRRPTELIFTLEDIHNNEVLGRRRLGIRVCSCPKRDKDKEEMDSSSITPGAKKRKINGQPPPPPPPGKKLMTNNSNLDTQVYNVNFNVVGRDNYHSILKYGYDLMAGQALRNDQVSLMQPYLNDILQKSSL